MNEAFAILIAYLLGAFPAAYIMGRVRKGIDIREVGSRNMGAMNVIYQVGPVEGVTVIFLDIVKGVLAVFIAMQLSDALWVHLVAGATAVIGHAFPVYLGFRGGKGGATCIGVLAILLPQGDWIYIVVLLVSLAITRYLTLSYSIALLTFPFVAWLIYDSLTMVLFSIGLLLLPAVRYIPRVREMRAKAGSWRGVVLHSSLKQRL